MNPEPACATSIIHYFVDDKPAVETFSTIFGGFLFGWVAYRTKSFLYPFLIHWFVASFTILVAVGAIG